MGRNKTQSIILPTIDLAKCGIANSNRLLQHGSEHRLHIARRAADDLKHLRRRRLLLKGLAQLCEQPRVLNGDDRLVGKIGYQLDLAFGEWPHFPVINGDGSYQLIFFQHWYVDHTPIATQFDAFDYKWIALDIGLYGRHVGDLRNLARIK